MHLVNQKKQQAWKDFCSNVEYISEMSLLKDKDSNFNPKEAVKILLRTHFPDHLECLGLGTGFGKGRLGQGGCGVGPGYWGLYRIYKY